MRIAAACTCCAALVLFAPPAHGAFETVPVSARAVSAGGTFVSVADDASAVLRNPAGLSGLGSWQILLSGRRPYDAGINEGAVVGAVPSRWGAIGFAWTHRGLPGAYTENVLTLALARDIARTSEDASLSVGITIDAAWAVVTERIVDRDAALSGGAGVLLRPFPMVGIGYQMRNVTRPVIRLTDGAGTELSRTQSWGVGWYWDDRATIRVERRRVGGRPWTTHGGVEVRLTGGVALRSGISRGTGTFGLGYASGRFGADFSWESGDVLGSSVMVTLKLSAPRGRNHARAR